MLGWLLSLALAANPAVPLTVKLDSSEAEAALAIAAAPSDPSKEAIARLTATRPYQRLHQREEGMRRSFTDAEFIAFLRAPETRRQAGALRRALEAWDPGSVEAAAIRAAAYLPKGSRLRATIYPMVKIRPNTFVFETRSDPAIFYAIDATEPPAKFLNTLAHELHHLGIGQNCPDEPDARTPLATLRKWVGAFNEGFAMVAAAGGAGRHPHATSTPAERAVWDEEAARLPEYVAEQDRLFRAVLAGKAGNSQAIDRAMFAYYGTQGPWYSVGWRMAVTIEQELGRPAAIAAFCRPRSLLATYNKAAEVKQRRTGVVLPRWNARLAAMLAG